MLKRSGLAISVGIILVLDANSFAQEKPVRPADLTKTVRIEKPATTILVHESGAAANTGKEFVNPKVQPGVVHWHPSMRAACDAARKSGKPVLVFQMMGKLDDQFC